MKVVIALGGNALAKKENVSKQRENVKAVMEKLKPVLEKNKVAITHGNGFQVGILLEKLEWNLGLLTAMTQGQIGHWINLALKELGYESTTIVTHILVSSLGKRTKPVGKAYAKKRGEDYFYEEGRGWRKFVYSPKPRRILELEAIKENLERRIVVCCGGGGVPVIEEKGKLNVINGVIDKDLASSLLAKEIRADIFLIVTSVPFVYRNYGKENEKPIEYASIQELEELLKEGEFGEGNMKPKVEAVINFVKATGKKAIICGIENVEEAIKGESGTIVSQ